MTIRGGGDTRWAVVSIPLEECARRPGALPPKRMTASWSGPDPGPTEYKVAARCNAPKAGSPPIAGQPPAASASGPRTHYVTMDNAMHLDAFAEIDPPRG